MKQFKNIPLGAKKDTVDNRDKLKSTKISKCSFKPLVFPKKYVLPFLPPIKNQGITNSCTGHASAWFWEQILVSRGYPWMKFSPFYHWYYARKMEGTENLDEGVQMRSIMSSLNKYGVTLDELWPFGSPINKEPTEESQIYATLKLPVYERCQTLQDIKYSLVAETQSVCAGVNVYSTWYSENLNFTGIISSNILGNILGYHAIVICGYDDEKQTVLFANSWGTLYGKKGFVELPYVYFEQSSFDAWTAGFDTIPDIR
jgi:C1A family cysteine protease